MSWIITCIVVTVIFASLGAGWFILGRAAPWWLALPVGFLCMAGAISVVLGISYGLETV